MLFVRSLLVFDVQLISFINVHKQVLARDPREEVGVKNGNGLMGIASDSYLLFCRS